MGGSNLHYILLFQLPPSFPARQAFGSAELLDSFDSPLRRKTEVEAQERGGEGLGS